MVLLDHKAITVILEMWVLQVTMVHPGHKVLLVQLALQAHKALKALKALQVLKDPQELLARKVHQEVRDLVDPLGNQVPRVPRVLKDQLLINAKWFMDQRPVDQIRKAQLYVNLVK